MQEIKHGLQKNFCKNDVIIVIPTYKEELSEFEQISLQQIHNILNEYNIAFAAPDNLNFYYGEQYSTHMIERFDAEYFADISGYNKLMLSDEFYMRFAKYSYILIAQLDAFIFSDKLLYFCNLGYDYIGAPWIHGTRYYKDVYNIIHYVGNGGLSLRKVDRFIKWIDKCKYILEPYIDEINEDVLISAYGKEFLKIACFDDALQFSFDFDPRGSYLLNNSELPFGIHAWPRYDIEFCRPFIEKNGYQIKESDTERIREEYSYRYSYEDKRNQYLNGLVASGKEAVIEFTAGDSCKLFLWGTGLWGELVGRIFNDLHIEYAGFVDNAKKEETLLGHLILDSEEYLKEHLGDSKILISVFYPSDIRNQLDSIGLVHKKDYLILDDFINEMENT